MAYLLFDLLILNKEQLYLFDQIQTSQTGGQLYIDTSSYRVSQCYLPRLTKVSMLELSLSIEAKYLLARVSV